MFLSPFARLCGVGCILVSLLSCASTPDAGEPVADGGSASPLAGRVRELLSGFQGNVSLYAKNLDTGEDFALQADEPIRTASTIKVPVMVACYRAVAEGTARWEEKIPVSAEAKVSGSGIIREFEDDTLFTLRDLMHVMIVVSDNTATNLVIGRLTADYVNETMDRMGFVHTRSMRKIRGDGSQLKEATGWSKEGEKEENKRFGIGRSTPMEMARLLEMLAAGEVVSPEASREMVEVLKRQQYKDGIGRTLGELPGVEVASKSGALDALRSDVGIVFHPNGRLVIAATVDGMAETDYSPDNRGNLLISRLSGILVQELLSGDGVVPNP